MKITRSKLTALFLAAVVTCASHAGHVKQTEDTTSWQAGVDGVEIEWGSNGEVSRIYSAFYQPVSIPDRRGISKAQIIAEEKAKAAVIRFMEQQVSSKRTVEQIDKDLETATVVKGAGADVSKKENQRIMVETLSEVTSSYASGKLRGVIVLEKGYDEKKGEAWVKVGISKKTMTAASALSAAVNEPVAAANSTTTTEVGAQPSEIRRTTQKNW